MTTKLYPNDYFGGPENYDEDKDAINERSWLMNEIIKPELPNILGNVKKCLEMLHSDQVFKMPISSNASSGNNPSIKGIVVRQGSFLLDFKAIVVFPEFHKGREILLRMNTGQKFLLAQIDSIEKNLCRILRLLEDLQMVENLNTFTENFGTVLRLLFESINLIQNPPRQLSFPESNNHAVKQMFQNYEAICATAHHEISLDIVLFKSELCIDIRNLSIVTKKPWSNVDPVTGQSFSDTIKDELTMNRSKNLATTLEDNGIHIEEPSLINNIMMSTFNTDTTTLAQAQYYLNRCITFNRKTVIECEKLEITTSDPSLISITSKLNALESSITNYYTNLKV